jgi:hypothetical protein
MGPADREAHVKGEPWDQPTGMRQAWRALACWQCNGTRSQGSWLGRTQPPITPCHQGPTTGFNADGGLVMYNQRGAIHASAAA